MKRTIEMTQEDELETQKLLDKIYDKLEDLQRFEDEFISMQEDCRRQLYELYYESSSAQSQADYMDLADQVFANMRIAEMDISDTREKLKREERRLDDRLDELYKERKMLYLLEEEEKYGKDGSWRF